jgi:NDP-sugar pyrophosphorylase family protein
MEYIDYGLSVLSAKLFAGYAAGQPFDLAEVYHQLSISGELAGYEVHERFYEIGSPEGLKEVETYFQMRDKA